MFATRVVSMPCVEWFVEQDEECQDSVLPVDPVVVTVEAGSTIGWRDLIGADGSVGIDHLARRPPEPCCTRSSASQPTRWS